MGLVLVREMRARDTCEARTSASAYFVWSTVAAISPFHENSPYTPADPQRTSGPSFTPVSISDAD